ncbi:MAG: 1-phosphofructokinase [Armatimonadetes bacterium]|nr:1-phosphofructokinase [Armatimonadota bacterium]
MILTVTPNPAIDKTYVVDGFSLRGIRTPRVTMTTPGGKGVNVARVCAILGCPVVATGFVGGHNGRFLTQELERTGVLPDFVPVGGETRVCVEIVDPDRGVQTKINEPGPHIGSGDVAHLEAKVTGWLGRAQFAVLSGGGPPGTPPDLYSRLVHRARQAGVRVMLDAAGALLREGVAAAPFMVKPNAEELASLAGVPVCTPEDAASAARALLQSGIAIAAVSLGADGVVVAQGTSLLYAQPPPVEVVSTVGSGDCMAAGFALALTRGLPLHAVARWGVAAGAANASALGPGLCTRAEIEDLLPQVKVTRLA